MKLQRSNSLLLDISLWSGDLLDLRSSISAAEYAADCFHIDVADGHFAPSLLLFPDQVAAIRAETKKPLHVHLMVQNTQYWIDEFADAGADIITVHVEQPDVDDLLDQIHNHGCSAGIALKVETPVSALTPLVHKPDLILLLGTSIGIKGASISNNAFERIEDTVSLLKDHDRRDDVIVTADGGVRNHTVEPLRSAGADMITPGSLFFGNPDLALAGETIHKLATNNA